MRNIYCGLLIFASGFCGSGKACLRRRRLPCGMNAIGQDEYGHAKIDHDKCVSCGMCLVNCPFGAIVDKGQLFQLIHAIRRGDEVVAVIAPAFWGQFGDNVTPGQIKAAMQQLGFAALEEVAVGADLCAVEEAEEFLRMVPEKQPFMATSCCPAWSVMAKKEFPGFAPYISMTMTPMVLTARLQKRRRPGCRVVFIGPCAAKKLEASRRTVRSDPRRGFCRFRRRGQGGGGGDPPAGPRPRGKDGVCRGAGSAARCCVSPGRASMTAICWRVWPVRWMHCRRRHNPAAGEVPAGAGTVQGQRTQG